MSAEVVVHSYHNRSSRGIMVLLKVRAFSPDVRPTFRISIEAEHGLDGEASSGKMKLREGGI